MMNHRNLMVKFTYKVEGKGGSQAEECFTFEWEREQHNITKVAGLKPV